jgi:2-oxoglutarate ferredoxin oxidoreductase subunit gamma
MEKACGVRVFRDVDSAGDGTGRGAQAGSGPRGNGGSAGSLRGRAMSGFMDDMELPELLNVNHEEKINPVNTLKSDSRVVISGRSGQGVVSAGILLANAAVHEGLEAVMLPSYGPQTRGGAARADIVVSAEPGASPVFTKPTALLALDAASLDEYEDSVEKGGLIIVNSSLAGRRIRRRDVNVIYAPVNAMAEKSGYVQGANIIMLSVYLLFTGTPCLATLKDVVPKSINRKELMDVSLKLVESAEDFFGPDVTVYPES